MIFQDPYNSVDPYWTVEKIIAETCVSKERVRELMQAVGLPEKYLKSYPHELSGGQLQRVGIARCLGSGPDFIVCDEPVSALDVSYQSKIISLLEDLQKEKNLTYVFISHDLAVVRHISDRIMVMYGGQIMECGLTDEIIDNALHPYTRYLLSAVPAPFETENKYELKSSDRETKGCPFARLCPKSSTECFKERPESVSVSDNHQVFCHNV